MHLLTPETLAKRVVAATPEVTLAWACYVGARDALAGEPADLYLWALMAIELVSLAWFRLVMTPATLGRAQSRLRLLLGLGGTGVSVLMVLLNGAMLPFVILFVMIVDPHSFVLLLLALTRRSLWLWAWGVRDPEKAPLLAEHLQRISRAHWFAALAAMAAALLFNHLQGGSESLRTNVVDAFWLAGMAGYFASLAIYLLAGRAPVPDDPRAEPTNAVRPFSLVRVLQQGRADWTSLVPGILLLWGVMELIWPVVPDEGEIIASPIGIGFSGWLLLSGACRTLGLTKESGWQHGKAHAPLFGYVLIILWMMSLFLLFVSVPIVYGILDLDFDDQVEMSTPVTAGFAIALLAILWILARLLPACTLPFVTPPQAIAEDIVALFRKAWRLTGGFWNFVHGALPTFLALAVALYAVIISADVPFLGKLLIYCVLAPIVALVAADRADALDAIGRIDLAVESVPAAASEKTMERPATAPAPPIVPIPVPVIAPDVSVREYHYDESWSLEDRFFTALINDDLARVRSFLDSGVSVDLQYQGETALHYALRLCSASAVRFLLDRGADVYAASPTGACALHYAASRAPMVPFLDELYSWWEQPDPRDHWEQTPLMSSMRALCVPGANKMLDLGADVHMRDRYGGSALHHLVTSMYGTGKGALTAEKIALATRLLDQGSDPCLCGLGGQSSMTTAAAKGLGPLLQLFATRGFDVTRIDEKGLAPITTAAIAGHAETVRQLQDAGAPLDFPSAVCIGDTAAARAQLERDPRLATARFGENGVTALTLAILHQRRSLAELLLASGADVNAPDPYRGTILHHAIEQLPYEAFVRRIVAGGAAVNAMEHNGETALHLAARRNLTDIADLLLENGWDPNARSDRNYTPCTFAKNDAMKALLARFGGSF